jgi:pSer/pThr/pTyr-binding forkhead associated (FHA) protein
MYSSTAHSGIPLTYSFLPVEPFHPTRINGRCLPIGQPVVVGRDATAFIEIHQSQRTVSRRHAVLFADTAGGLFIADCDSRNGTFVNGERLPGIGLDRSLNWRLLDPSDLVSLGGAFFLTILRPEAQHD